MPKTLYTFEMPCNGLNIGHFTKLYRNQSKAI